LHKFGEPHYLVCEYIGVVRHKCIRGPSCCCRKKVGRCLPIYRSTPWRK